MIALTDAAHVKASAEVLLSYGVGALSFIAVIGVWRATLEANPQAKRVRMMARRREELSTASVGKRPRAPWQRSRGALQLLRRLQVARSARADQIRGRLVKAGLRSREAVAVFLAAKLGLPVAAALLGGAAFYGLHVPAFSANTSLLLLVGTILGSWTSPDLLLMKLTTRRRRALQRALPDALDLLVICAEAGLSLDAALHRVSEEMASSAPEMANEIALTSIELNFLPDRRQALVNLAARCDLESIRSVVNTLCQTERYGTPLAQSLRVLSSEFREERMLKAEEKAARLPATLTVPMILFILPTLFIVIIGPAIIDIYDNLIH